VIGGNVRWGLFLVQSIDTRARYLDQDAELEQAYDPYVLMRDVWLQNRQYQIFDGDPPLQDYDLYLEDFDEEPEPGTGNTP
jgi:phospholipid-binding lipoprotein MlaA